MQDLWLDELNNNEHLNNLDTIADFALWRIGEPSRLA